MRPIAFTARCQTKTIQEQYELGVRCFDLRVRWVKWKFQLAHGIVEYDMSCNQLYNDLKFLNEKGDCMVRILHETRTEEQYKISKPFFQSFCYTSISNYQNIKWWCGRNLYNWQKDYNFGDDPSCEENYASVSCKWLAWWPWLYARINNRKIIESETGKDVLLIDYVNIK